MRNSSGPDPLPALMSCPTSVLRAVTTPSNGATTFSKPDNSRSRWTFAFAACTCASLEAARLIFSSASCLETESVARRLRQRSAVTAAIFWLASAVATSACAWRNC